MINYDKIIRIQGSASGPTSVILAGVHGDEICGVEAFKIILPNISIERGEVLFIYGNPRAIKDNVRFTEANLNRMFKEATDMSDIERSSYEYRRSQKLRKYLDQADMLLDVHASFIPNSSRFIICENNGYDLASNLPVDIVVSGFDAVQPGGTDYYMNKNNKIGICVECGYLGDQDSISIAINSIDNFLKAVGHNSGKLSVYSQSKFNIYKQYYSKTDNFVLTNEFRDFEVVTKDQIVGMDGPEKIVASKESIILFARNTYKKGEECFLLGEKI